MHVKKNDTVQVLAGKARGKRGRVLSVDPSKQRALVENLALMKRHTRPQPQRNIKGGIVEREAPIHVSNLMVVCGECGKPTRVARRRLEDGGGLRACRRCGGALDKVKG